MTSVTLTLIDFTTTDKLVEDSCVPTMITGEEYSRGIYQVSVQAPATGYLENCHLQ